MPRAANAPNTCTDIVVYKSFIKTLPDELRDAFETSDMSTLGACDYCGNFEPKMRFIGCSWHRACEKCHMNDTDTKVVDQRGKCAIRGCACAVTLPLARDHLLEKHAEIKRQAEAKFVHALTSEASKFKDKDTEIARLKEKCRIAEAALAEVEQHDPMDAEDAPAPAAAPRARGRANREGETEEERRERILEEKEKRAWGKEKKRRIERYPERDELACELEAIEQSVGFTREQEEVRAARKRARAA